MKPLHAAALFPIKPCKQAHSAGVVGSWGAEGRDGVQACSIDMAAGPAGPPALPRRSGMPRDSAGALGLHRAASPSPDGRCGLRSGGLAILGRSWAGSGGAGSWGF